MPKLFSGASCRDLMVGILRQPYLNTNIDPLTTSRLDRLSLAELRVRLGEQSANQKYYEVLMNSSPTCEYENSNIKVFTLDGSDRFFGKHTELVCVDTNDPLPIYGVYIVAKYRFLKTSAAVDVHSWASPGFWENPTTYNLIGGVRADFYIRRLIVNKFNTLCCKSWLSPELKSLAVDSINDQFSLGHYVYQTTENGTIRLPNIEALDESLIWGTDDIFNQRYISFSKVDLLPE